MKKKKVIETNFFMSKKNETGTWIKGRRTVKLEGRKHPRIEYHPHTYKLEESKLSELHILFQWTKWRLHVQGLELRRETERKEYGKIPHSNLK